MMQQLQIIDALERTRTRRIFAAVVSNGGRWALLPAVMVALTGVALWLAFKPAWLWMLPLAALGLAGVACALAWVRLREARPIAGTPPEAFMLDRALALNDALPAYLESRGDFRNALERRVAAAIAAGQPAVFRRSWLPLLAALLLALAPLALLPPAETPEPPQQVAQEPEPQAGTEEQPNQGGAGPAEKGGESGDAAPGDGEAESSSGGGGGGGAEEADDTAAQPAPESQPGAGDAPEDAAPQPAPPPDAPQPGEAGDDPEGMKPPEAPQQPEIEQDAHRIKPEAGEGETTQVDRSRWVYNPDGVQSEGAAPKPPELEHGGERVIPRTKVTSRERRVVNELYRKLFE